MSQVTGKDTDLKPIDRFIDFCDDVLEVTKREQEDNRRECLFAADPAGWTGVDENGRLDQVMTKYPTASKHGSPIDDCLLNPLARPLNRFERDHWSKVGLRVQRIAELQRTDSGDELTCKLVENVLMNENSLHRDTDLTSVGIPPNRDSIDREADVGVSID